MAFPPDLVPPGAGTLDHDAPYGVDTPFNVKQAALTHRRHRWFDPRPIGLQGAPGVVTPGLPAGQTMRIAFDNRPDWLSISISGQTAATGRCMVYLGEPGGNGFLLGPHGDAVLPCPHDGVISIVNVGTTSTFGVICAIAGYTDPGVKVTCGD